MAWLYQRPDSERWWIGFRQHGAQFLRSTGTSNKTEAQKQLARVEAMLVAQRADILSNELFAALTGKARPNVTLKAALDDWLAEASGATGKRTLEKYTAFAGEVSDFFKANEQGPLLDSITREDVQRLLGKKRATVSAGTANMGRKLLQIFFKRSKARGYMRENPAEGVKLFKAGREELRVRRPFTLDEMRNLYAIAPDDFWRFMLVAGFFTGLRMGDLVTLPVGAVNWQAKTLNLTTRKTGAPMHIPIAEPLFVFLLKLRAERKTAAPSTPFWPEHAKRYEQFGSGWFGQRFHDLLLVKAGLVKSRPHRSGGKTKSDRRTVNEVSFHCLRHSYVSTLAALGQNQQLVKALAGHSGDAINDLYTHLPAETLKEAVGLLPDITTTAQEAKP